MAAGHTHAHAPANIGRAFAIGVALNLGFVIAEFLYGRLAHSLALVADAGHNLSDVLSLLLAWGAMLLSKRLPTQRRTYGFRRSSILASLINAGAAEVRTAVEFRTGDYEPDFYALATKSTIVLPWDREVIVEGELVLNPAYGDALRQV